MASGRQNDQADLRLPSARTGRRRPEIRLSAAGHAHHRSTGGGPPYEWSLCSSSSVTGRTTAVVGSKLRRGLYRCSIPGPTSSLRASVEAAADRAQRTGTQFGNAGTPTCFSATSENEPALARTSGCSSTVTTKSRDWPVVGQQRTSPTLGDPQSVIDTAATDIFLSSHVALSPEVDYHPIHPLEIYLSLNLALETAARRNFIPG